MKHSKTHLGTLNSPLNERRAKKAGLIIEPRYRIITFERGYSRGRVHMMQHPTKTAEAYVQAFYYNL